MKKTNPVNVRSVGGAEFNGNTELLRVWTTRAFEPA